MAFFDRIMLPVKNPSKGSGTLKPVYNDELILGTFRMCDLLDCNLQGTPYTQGLAVVSSHNLYWHTHDFNTIVRVELQSVSKVETHNSIFRKVHRCDFYLINSPIPERSLPGFSVTFGNKNSNSFKKLVETSLERQLWKQTKIETMQRNSIHHQEGITGVYMDANKAVGVAGIIQRQQQQREISQQVADEAFSDLDSLMKSAQALVQVVERYSDELSKNKGKERSEEEKESTQFFNLLNDIGIANPATKKKCGSSYHSELAYELSDFLLRSLDRHSTTGMMALTDLYCVVNRARGTELISPNDLFQACSLFSELNLPFKLRKFDSGALVVQSAKLNDDVIISKIRNLLNDEGDTETCPQNFVTNITVAKKLAISLAMADDHLGIAESVGDLCRDDTVQETRFYPNRFTEESVRHYSTL